MTANVTNNMFLKDTREVENGTWKVSAMATDVQIMNKVVELENILRFSEQKIKNLEMELAHSKEVAELHSKDKLESFSWYQEQLKQALKEKDSALKAQESLEIMEMEAKWLKTELSDSQSKISELEQKLSEATKNSENFASSIRVWREREMLLKDQLQAVQLKAEIAEEKFIMQTELLQQDMKMRRQKEDELTDALLVLNKNGLDASVLTEKLLQLEHELKNLNDESNHNQENCIKTVEFVVKELENLPKLVNLPISNDQQLKDTKSIINGAFEHFDLERRIDSERIQKPSLYDYTSHDQTSYPESQQSSKDALERLEEEMAAMEQELEDFKNRESELMSKLSSYEDQVTIQEGVIREISKKCKDLEDIVASQDLDTDKKKLDEKCAEAQIAFWKAASQVQKLDEKLKLFDRLVAEVRQEETLDLSDNQAKSASPNSRFVARSISMPLRRPTPKMKRESSDQNISKLGCSERIDEGADEVVNTPRAHSISHTQDSFYISLKPVIAIAIISIIIGFFLGKH